MQQINNSTNEIKMKSLKQLKEHGYRWVVVVKHFCFLGDKGDIHSKHYNHITAIKSANKYQSFLQILNIDDAILKEKQRWH